MMLPAVPVPPGQLRPVVDLTLKEGWSYNERRRVFTSASGETFAPRADLPRTSRILFKVPAVARAAQHSLTAAERDLSRYMQVILPTGVEPGDYLEAVRGWPAVSAASLPPSISLPRQAR